MTRGKIIKCLFFLCSYLLCSVTFAQAQTSNISPFSVTPLVANKLIQKNQAILVDVRENDEIKSGMASPALWIPFSRLKDSDSMFTDFLNSLPKDKLIIFYCGSGKRAQKAQLELKTRGYRTSNMGGFSDWVKAELPTRKPE